MRIHLFIVFITHKFRTSKKLVEIRGGGGGGASLGLEIQAGGGVQLTRKSGREMGKKKILLSVGGVWIFFGITNFTQVA